MGSKWRALELKVMRANGDRTHTPEKHVYDEIKAQLSNAVTGWVEHGSRKLKLELAHAENTCYDLEIEKQEITKRLRDIEGELDVAKKTRHKLLGESMGVYA